MSSKMEVLLVTLLTTCALVIAICAFTADKQEARRIDKVYAEATVEQKLDMIYQQNKELKQMVEECRIWILAK